MNEKEELQKFIIRYMHLRKKQNDYFKFRSVSVLKECKYIEAILDAHAQKLMIDLNMNFSISPETPKLF